jgi:hypothetical protein
MNGLRPLINGLVYWLIDWIYIWTSLLVNKPSRRVNARLFINGLRLYANTFNLYLNQSIIWGHSISRFGVFAFGFTVEISINQYISLLRKVLDIAVCLGWCRPMRIIQIELYLSPLISRYSFAAFVLLILNHIYKLIFDLSREVIDNRGGGGRRRGHNDCNTNVVVEYRRKKDYQLLSAIKSLYLCGGYYPL